MVYTLVWSQTSGTSWDDNQGELSFANEFDTNTSVIGEKVTKITIYLKKTGTPTGDIKGHLWFGTDPNAPSRTSNETYTADDVGTSKTTLTFTFTNITALSQYDLAGFTFSDLGTASHHYQYQRKTGGAVDGTYTAKGNTTSWSYPVSKTTTMDMEVYEGVTPSGDGILLPPPYSVHRV